MELRKKQSLAKKTRSAQKKCSLARKIMEAEKTWSKKPGAKNLEQRTWSKEPGAKNLEAEKPGSCKPPKKEAEKEYKITQQYTSMHTPIQQYHHTT